MSSERRVNVAAASKKKRVNAEMPKKKKAKLGQNFLVDPGASQRIVEALGDIASSIVLEIGPGRGALTKMLSQRAGRLIAVEFDRMLAAQLRIQYSRTPNVEI